MPRSLKEERNEEIKRLPRLAAILMLLQTKRLVTATELAKRFGVSVRTIYRDIRALEVSGVPIGVEEGKGYSLGEGYKLPPVTFTEREANALITAEQIVLRTKDSSLKKEFTEAIDKIRAILRYAQKDKAELLAARVYVGRPSEGEPTSDCLMDLQMALTEFRLVRILYRAADGTDSDRLVEPFAIYNSYEEDWTMAAYCRMRRDFRAFRLDRIQGLQVLEERFEPHRMTVADYAASYVERKSKKS